MHITHSVGLMMYQAVYKLVKYVYLFLWIVMYISKPKVAIVHTGDWGL